jgi:hypothetical protein
MICHITAWAIIWLSATCFWVYIYCGRSYERTYWQALKQVLADQVLAAIMLFLICAFFWSLFAMFHV